jgi:hypothetical protein
LQLHEQGCGRFPPCLPRGVIDALKA